MTRFSCDEMERIVGFPEARVTVIVPGRSIVTSSEEPRSVGLLLQLAGVCHNPSPATHETGTANPWLDAQRNARATPNRTRQIESRCVIMRVSESMDHGAHLVAVAD